MSLEVFLRSNPRTFKLEAEGKRSRLGYTVAAILGYEAWITLLPVSPEGHPINFHQEA